MKKLSAADEQKLLECVEKTADYVNEGMHPTDAVVKAASQIQARPGEVRLVVHAYNTGRTAKQRVSGNDPFEKSADFELADAAEVLEQLYPSQVKSAAQQHLQQQVSTEYGYSPQPMLQRRARRLKLSQAHDWTSIGGEPVRPCEPYPQDQAALMRKAASQADRLRREAEEHRRKAAAAFDEMARTMEDLTEYFHRSDAKPIPVVKEAVILMHGDKGKRVMDQLLKVSPGLGKLAMHRTGKSLLGPIYPEKLAALESMDCRGEPFDGIARLLQQIDQYKLLRQQWHDKQADYVRQAEVLLAPFVRANGPDPSILGTSSIEVGEKTAAASGGIFSALGAYGLMRKTLGDTGERFKPPDSNNQVNKLLSDMDDPAHENRLRQIQTQAVLQDLLSHDPVISSYDPEEVTAAFNDIEEVIPTAGNRRLIMQSMLRKQLEQGNLDPIDIEQMMRINRESPDPAMAVPNYIDNKKRDAPAA